MSDHRECSGIFISRPEERRQKANRIIMSLVYRTRSVLRQCDDTTMQYEQPPQNQLDPPLRRSEHPNSIFRVTSPKILPTVGTEADLLLPVYATEGIKCETGRVTLTDWDILRNA